MEVPVYSNMEIWRKSLFERDDKLIFKPESSLCQQDIKDIFKYPLSFYYVICEYSKKKIKQESKVHINIKSPTKFPVTTTSLHQ